MIRVENLSKYYGGNRALGPVSFEIEDGETVGFLGLNGAGKTTALRILACDLRPSSGTVSIGDVDAVADPHAVRKRVGFLPESPPVYQDMTVTDYLKFAGQLRGMDTGAFKKRAPEVLDLTHLSDVSSELIGHLSHGYRQRVGVAQAIIHAPDLLILDEPTRGLDPVQIVEMRNMINDLKEKHTVLISSHILTEISQTCDRLLVLGRGELLAKGTEAEIEAQMTQAPGAASAKSKMRVTVGIRVGDAYRSSDVTKAISAIDGVEAVAEPVAEGRMHLYDITCDKDLRAEISRAVINAGHDLLKLDRQRSELEGVFLKLIKGGAPTPADVHAAPADGKAAPADGKPAPADGKPAPADVKAAPADGKADDDNDSEDGDESN